MDTKIFDRLVILEMANNHMGSIDHGLRIIEEFSKLIPEFSFRLAIKFQYRDLDTLIHPDYRSRMDIKYIKRFSETRLRPEDFLRMKEEAEQRGFLTLCTPFDERSVDLVIEHGFPIIKIASCSFNDWPLLEKIAKTDRPIIASTAGVPLGEIDKVADFFEHRKKTFALMHCVGSYPTPDSELELNQIDFFKRRYPDVPIGFSTHEDPNALDPVKIAVAKGAEILERHIGLATDQYSLNAYSSTPDQIRRWLQAAESTKAMCGVSGKRRSISEKEASDIRGLQRGAFIREGIQAGQTVHSKNVFFAMPNVPGQLIANDFSKYCAFTSSKDLAPGSPLILDQLIRSDHRDKIIHIVNDLCALLKAGNIKLQDKLDFELSHHHGIEHFYEYGCAIITCVNREYCKKIILVLPDQKNPVHAHFKKEETFHVLHGDLDLTLDDEKRTYTAGDIVVVERGKKHGFSTKKGVILEEISTTHYPNDSYYDDPDIGPTESRKTFMTFHVSWMDGDIH
ncbi:MAG: N-acetylneuraminate synthase family protein [Planctomycetia bacterium]|nr:N-acetylneuraminate synthase family protein [Planctomycetia bacterium]